jgi:hypothetical protein
MARNTQNQTQELVELKALVARIAEAKGKEPTVVAKQVRNHIRRNFDDLTKQWPGLGGDNGKQNRDSSRYPAMPAKTAEAMFASMTTTKAPEAEAETK